VGVVLTFTSFILLLMDAGPGDGFWQGFGFHGSAHTMIIAAFGSLLGEAILAVNAYRQHNGRPDYYRKAGF
jgi:hypothetical protein